jgi:hypothetical protein
MMLKKFILWIEKWLNIQDIESSFVLSKQEKQI